MTHAGPMDANTRGSQRGSQVRCPYCVEASEFKLMVARDSDQWFTCENCGHLVMPKNPDFKCVCAKCATLEIRSRGRIC